ncbi:exodeoxyribonuclease I [Methylophaga sp. OBS3]|uniref:exodeoxyribonuclease I n=1 Tax=Methylophaga sp. OBS3 TaxID=2991934 RepID=UPI00225B199E|nr:exodeoxyribonuclease I [Methylophaga sp. OBS3]MCX4190863.1 exodeoxyribonuclease I [Methylophaga sp. OBS3]
MNTLYWHDYETGGTDPRYDRPLQFAGLRTDEDLNIVGEPLMIYCQPAGDYLPHPQAALITGITPQLATEKGLPEAEFIKQIHDQLAQPGTCGVGYNSLRFDDEFTRFTLFRNFYDAYAREWQNGNSRWDIIDMVRLTRALRPGGINWPNREDGLPSFRLEALTAANDIAHVGAHDALADVKATIDMARLIKTKQPKLYDHVYQLRRKQQVAPLLNLRDHTPVLHVSRMYPSEYCNTALVMPIARDPRNQNGIVVYDLRYSPEALLNEDAETLRQWLFTPSADLPEGVQRPALKTVHINKCPVVVPAATLDDAAAERLQIDRDLHHQHFQLCLQNAELLAKKIHDIFNAPTDFPLEDVDGSLYGGGFFDTADKQKMQQIQQSDPVSLANFDQPFNDPRLGELLFRYRARNWPESLSKEDQKDWLQFCKQRLQQTDSPWLTFERFFAALAESREQTLTPQQQQVLVDLEQFALNKQQILKAAQ